jgi:two-component system sensor kinase FixL
MTEPSAPEVLVIDDDRDTCENLADVLGLDGYAVRAVGSAAEALRLPDWGRFFAVILDRRLPDGLAEDLLPRLRRQGPDAAFIIVTGYSDLESAIAAIRQGAADYILKPVNPDLIRSRLAGLLERRRAVAEILRLNTDLRRRVSELQTLLDVLPVGIAIVQDPDGDYLQLNPALARMLGGPAAGRVFRLSRAGKELASSEAPLYRAATQGVEVKDEELELLRDDGTVLNVYVYAAPLLDERKQPRGAVGVFLDVTERKREQERSLQTERLAAIGQMVTGLAHESGNALARSQSCLEMLAWEVEDRPAALDLISRIQKAQDHLRQLYEEVRGYAAPLKLARADWDLSGVWRQTWENLAVARSGRDAALSEDTGGIDLVLPMDPFRLDQVFRNVFENALAACPDPVRVEVRCAETTLEGRPAVCVSVRDNGPGLPPETRRRIFDPFYTTKTKGTGLGMAIAKRITEAHGGRIAVGEGVAHAPQAPSGPGAEILITLPRQAPP